MGLSPWSLGIIFLIAVTLIWTFASLLTQFIYKDLGFDSPFVLTYISSSYFALHLPIRALLQYFGVIEDSTKRGKVYSELQSDGADSVDSDASDNGTGQASDRGDRSLLHHSSKSNTKEVEASRRYSAEVDREKGQTNSARPSESSLLVSRPSSRLRTWYQLVFRPLTADYTRSEVVRLGLLLSPIWLFSNLLYNYSLLLTSISSSTIISNTSGVFALVFAWALEAEEITYSKMAGVLLCVLGVALVSLQDTEAADDAVAHSLWGDIVAALGAALYGLFSTVLKIKVGSDETVPMQLVLGWTGALTALCFSPVLILMIAFNWDNVRSFTARIFGFISLSSLVDDVLGDYLFARAVLLTSPTVANVGMSITIPLAILSDAISSYYYDSEGYQLEASTAIGALLVILGFIVVNTGLDPALKLAERMGLCRRTQMDAGIN